MFTLKSGFDFFETKAFGLEN